MKPVDTELNSQVDHMTGQNKKHILEARHKIKKQETRNIKQGSEQKPRMEKKDRTRTAY